MAYKKDQGRMARMAAYWSLAILIFYGCHSLHNELNGRFASLKADLLGSPIPIIGVTFNGALIITGLLLAVALTTLYRWQQKPKVADLLIDTESELKKVTWPTMPEAINSSIVVLVTVLFLMAFLAGTDWVLGRWSTYFVLGG